MTITAAVIAHALSFLCGVFLGRYLERHQELTMDLSARTRLWYDRWAPAFVIGVALLAVAGIWIGTTATIVNGRQDDDRAAEAAARDAQTRDLLACFDRYAAAQSASSGAVRDASVVKDAATAERDRALRDVTKAIRRQDNMAAQEAFQRLEQTGERLVDAQAALDRARRDNPVPPPPSEFCSVKP